MSAEDAAPREGFYLPDFCAARMVLAVVLIAELIAVLLTLARQGFEPAFWTDLARTSLFLLWCGLGTAAVLCVARRRLAMMSVLTGSLLALALLLVVVALVSEAAWWVMSTRGVWLGLTDAAPRDHFAFLLRNLTVGTIAGSLALRYFFVSQAWRRNVEAESRARLRALQLRIRPHFLYNSMNTIASLTRSEPRLAERAVLDLADLFRASLSEARGRITLGEELEIARTYERIERLRLGDRLHVDWQVVSAPADALVPALLLQPLLENAIHHGIEPLASGGTVTVAAHRDGDIAQLVVRNPVAATGPGRSRNRVGLDNVRQRLELMFPGAAQVTVEQPPGEFVVTLRFPVTAGAT